MAARRRRYPAASQGLREHPGRRAPERRGVAVLAPKARRTEAPPVARNENKTRPADHRNPRAPRRCLRFSSKWTARASRDACATQKVLRVFQHALDLRTSAVESGVSGEGPSTEACPRRCRRARRRRKRRGPDVGVLSTASPTRLWRGRGPPGLRLRNPFAGFRTRAGSSARAGSRARASWSRLLRVIGSHRSRRLTSLRPSHLPGVTDATVLAAPTGARRCGRCGSSSWASRTRAPGAARPGAGAERGGGWSGSEVKACPYVRAAHPGVDFKRPPRRLATLRIQPGGAAAGRGRGV